jgi:hypothetical protein|tara:strand:+ start:26562 stop:26957 length:396 start_codon:yes stop_codon:yes gene_type:complete
MCGPKPPTKISLTIGATTANPFPPTLTDDSGFTSITEPADQKTTTLVSPGNIMIWKISEDITEINAITETVGDDVFSTNPTRQADGTWQGVVGNFPPGNEQYYSITYTVKGAPSNPYTQDPIMKIKPPKNT